MNFTNLEKTINDWKDSVPGARKRFAREYYLLKDQPKKLFFRFLKKEAYALYWDKLDRGKWFTVAQWREVAKYRRKGKTIKATIEALKTIPLKKAKLEVARDVGKIMRATDRFVEPVSLTRMLRARHLYSRFAVLDYCWFHKTPITGGETLQVDRLPRPHVPSKYSFIQQKRRDLKRSRRREIKYYFTHHGYNITCEVKFLDEISDWYQPLRVERHKSWSPGHKYPHTDVTVNVSAPELKRSELPAGVREHDGLLLLGYQNREKIRHDRIPGRDVTVYDGACWVRKLRGHDWETERGVIVETGGEVVHGQDREQALRTLVRRLRSSGDKFHDQKPRKGDETIVLTWEDCDQAGCCRPGVQAWLDRHSLGDEGITAAQALFLERTSGGRQAKLVNRIISSARRRTNAQKRLSKAAKQEALATA